MFAAAPWKPTTSNLHWRGGLALSPGLPVIFVIMLLAMVVAWGVVSGIIGIKLSDFALIFANIMILWGCGVAFRRIRLPRLGEAITIISTFWMMALAAMMATAVLARVSAPFCDDALFRLDTLLFGLDWKAMVLQIGSNKMISKIMIHAYESLTWQPQLLFIYFCMVERDTRSWQVISAMAVAMVLCIGIFPFFPAVGGYAYFGVTPMAVPEIQASSGWHFPEILRGLKSGHIHSLGREVLTGLVSMPSFHAASGVILAWGFWVSRWLRWPFAILNAAMLISAVPMGAHYLVDIVAGMAVAMVAIVAAKGYTAISIRLIAATDQQTSTPRALALPV